MTVESSTADAAIALIKQVGFPAFVCIWFMWRCEKKFDEVVAALRRVEDKL